nr:reverse transcriptase [Tanacetum cinerariifolium]
GRYSPTVIKANKVETARKPPVKYAEMYRNTSKSLKVRDKEVARLLVKPPGFQDLEFPNRVCKVEKAMYELHQAPRAWYGTLSKYLLDNGFQRVLQNKDGIFLSQDKYVGDILKKFGYSDVRSANTPMDKKNSWGKRWTWYALTINPTVYVSHIRQFWSTARIETSNEGTKILATVDGKLMSIFKSSIRRNLKLNDEEGISSLPGTELFENLALMGYNILPNQRFTFQKGQFSHKWKFLIHTIMQCLSPKSTGFNEFSSNIATVVVYLATNRVYNFSKMIFDGMVRNVNSKGSNFLMYPRFISKCLKMGQFGQIAHTHMYFVPFHTRKAFTTLRVNNPSFSGRTVSLFETMLVTQGEGSGTPTEPHHTPYPQAQQSPHHDTSSPSHLTSTSEQIPTATPTEIPTLRHYSIRATRIAQFKAVSTATDEPASLLRDDSQGEAFPTARIKLLEDKDRGSAEPSGDDAPIMGKSLEIGEEVGEERSTELGSNDTEEMVDVLSSMKAANILTSGFAAVSIPPVAGVSTVGISTVSRLVTTISAIFTTASVIDAQVAKEMEEEIAREYQRMNEQLARDAEIARLHAEEELKMMIEELTIGEKIELINELVKYQDHHAKIFKYQAQQSKPLSQKEQREFYMSVLRSHAGWKTRHFKEEGERVKRKGLMLEQKSAKKMNTSEEVSKEDLKQMMQLVPVEEVYVEALQVKHPIIDWEIYLEGKQDYWKIIRLGGHTAVYQFFVGMLK